MALARYEAFALDSAGNVLASPSVQVINEATSVAATLFSDRAGTVGLSNPFTGGSDGLIAFHVAGGAYKITVISGAVTRTFRYVGIGTSSETDAIGSAFLPLRERLTADLTLFVRNDGSDANDGRTNTSGGAYQHIMAAYAYLHNNIDCNGHSVTIQCAAGTYNEQLQIFGHLVGNHVFAITGDTVTPANCIINVGNSQTGIYAKDYGCVQINGFTFTGGTGAIAVSAEQYAIIDIASCSFGAHASGRFVSALNYGVINVNAGTIALTGNCSFPFICQNNGSINLAAGATISIATARAFNTFAWCDLMSRIFSTATISGAGVATTTGVRYNSTQNSVVSSNGGGANYFPGNSAGTTATGGIYI